MQFRCFYPFLATLVACSAQTPHLRDIAPLRPVDDGEQKVRSQKREPPTHATNQATSKVVVLKPDGTFSAEKEPGHILFPRQNEEGETVEKQPRMFMMRGDITERQRGPRHKIERALARSDKQNGHVKAGPANVASAKIAPAQSAPAKAAPVKTSPLKKADPHKTSEKKADPHRAAQAPEDQTACGWDPARKTFDSTLYGYGKCKLQLCNCLESRATSLVWNLVATCSTLAEPVDMVLTFRRRAAADEGVDGEGFLPDTESESFFAKTMKTFSDKKPVDPNVAPVWERIGFKLGVVSVPVDMLSSNAAVHPGQCNNDWISNGHVYARGLKNSRLLKTAGTGKVVGSVEFRTFLPVASLRLLTAKEQLVVPVLKSMTEAFRDYHDANVTHCDRGPNHITLGRAPSLGGMPVAQIIDTDRVKQGFDAWRMAHWFGAVVYKVCQQETTNPIELLFDGVGWTSGCADVDHQTAVKWLKEQLATAKHAADSDGMCRGMRQLVNSVVKPAFQVAMRIDQAPEDWWAGAIDKWAARFYPSSLPDAKEGKAQGLDLNMVFREAKLTDSTIRGFSR